MNDPYDDGQEAFFAGWDEDANPYDDSDAQHDQWASGWLDACQDAEESEP